MNETPAKILHRGRGGSDASRGTPEEELQELDLIASNAKDSYPLHSASSSSSYSNCSVSAVRHSLTPGPVRSESRSTRDCRLTPGAFERITQRSESKEKVDSHQDKDFAQEEENKQHKGPFDLVFSPLLRDPINMRYGDKSPTVPLQPIDRNSPRLQHPNAYVNTTLGEEEEGLNSSLFRFAADSSVQQRYFRFRDRFKDSMLDKNENWLTPEKSNVMNDVIAEELTFPSQEIISEIDALTTTPHGQRPPMSMEHDKYENSSHSFHLSREDSSTLSYNIHEEHIFDHAPGTNINSAPFIPRSQLQSRLPSSFREGSALLPSNNSAPLNEQANIERNLPIRSEGPLLWNRPPYDSRISDQPRTAQSGGSHHMPETAFGSQKPPQSMSDLYGQQRHSQQHLSRGEQFQFGSSLHYSEAHSMRSSMSSMSSGYTSLESCGSSLESLPPRSTHVFCSSSTSSHSNATVTSSFASSTLPIASSISSTMYTSMTQSEGVVSSIDPQFRNRQPPSQPVKPIRRGSGTESSKKHREETGSKPNRSDAVESPSSKAKYKQFTLTLAAKEEKSLKDALEYVRDEMATAPACNKWRMYLDVAEMYRRHNCQVEAKYIYGLVCEEYPHVHQSWIELSKQMEEMGEIESSLRILRKGNRKMEPFNEVLLLKGIKQHEKLDYIPGARELLWALHAEPMDKIWRCVLEGALVEERAGNVHLSRKLFAVLIMKVSWYGPIHYEAFRLEEKAELFENACTVVQRGLKELPRYGPMWFGLLRVMERRDVLLEMSQWQSAGLPPRLQNVRAECQNAVSCISRELVWKVHFEQAVIEERAAAIVAQVQACKGFGPFEACYDALLGMSRQCFALSLLSSPPNLRWKIFLCGSRMELSAGRIQIVKRLLRQAFVEVPDKSKYHVYLECSRLEEYLGNVEAARRVLSVARTDVKNEWKVQLESVLLEARAGNITAAIFLAVRALQLDSGSGRLWALLLQLVHKVEWKKNFRQLVHPQTDRPHENPFEALQDSFEFRFPPDYQPPSKYQVLRNALQVVPKSGEMWCEGARVRLNPLCADCFDPLEAMRSLSFAILFTPQYGDSFLEYIRLEVLLQVLLRRVLLLMGLSMSDFVQLVDVSDQDSDFLAMASACSDAPVLPEDTRSVRMLDLLRGQGERSLSASSFCCVRLERLFRRCLNADPNYGTSWFYFRERPIDTPGTVFDLALDATAHELVSSESIYMEALARFVAGKVRAKVQSGGELAGSAVDMTAWLRDWNEASSKTLCSAPLRSLDGQETFSHQDFITGSVKLNRSMYSLNWNLEERKKMLYGFDQISP